MLPHLLHHSYGIQVATITPISSGRINRNYKVVSTDGKEYCVKDYSDAVPDDRLHDGLRVAHYLAPLNFPVPVPVKTLSGDYLLRTDDTRYLVLEFLQGRNLLPAELTHQESFGMGEMLARLHHSLRFFPEANKLHDSLWKDSAHSILRAYELLNLIQDKGDHDEFDVFALKSLSYRIQVMQSTEIGPVQFAHLGRQALHGDYHLANIVFRGDGAVSGVLDFDQTCFSFPAWELMRAIGFTCYQGGTFSYTTARSILQGYLTTGDLAPAEYLEMPRLWYYQLVRGLWGLREHYQGEADPRQDEAAYGRHHTMVWLGKNLGEVRSFIWETIS